MYYLTKYNDKLRIVEGKKDLNIHAFCQVITNSGARNEWIPVSWVRCHLIKSSATYAELVEYAAMEAL